MPHINRGPEKVILSRKLTAEASELVEGLVLTPTRDGSPDLGIALVLTVLPGGGLDEGPAFEGVGTFDLDIVVVVVVVVVVCVCVCIECINV